jgi:hypothetical protein
MNRRGYSFDNKEEELDFLEGSSKAEVKGDVDYTRGD